MWQNLAFGLIIVGLLVLIGWMAQGFFAASEIPLMVRIAVGAIGAGGLLLIGVAVKDRLKKSDNDDFKEVER